MGLTTQEFLDRLKQLDVDVRAKDGKLLLTAPAGVLTRELQAELHRRKQEILTFLVNHAEPGGERWAPLTFAQQRLWLVAPGAADSNRASPRRTCPGGGQSRRGPIEVHGPE